MKLSFVFAFVMLFASGCGSAPQEGATPAQTMKNYVEAGREMDVAKLRDAFSRNSLKEFDEEARRQNISVEENMKKMIDPAKAMTVNIEMRNEKIEGDTATLEVKNALVGEWETVPFVKEDGRWKIAADRYREQILKE